MVETVRWDGKILWVLDQTKLPLEVVYEPCKTVEDTAHCIRDMLVRGAPAIGVTAAFGMVFAAQAAMNAPGEAMDSMKKSAQVLEETRPTAVNLAWATQRMLNIASQTSETDVTSVLIAEACSIYEKDIQSCRDIGKHAAPFVPDTVTILTHCNAGALATAGYGTALGVIRRAVEDGKKVKVFADETRPYLQGARLTAWELMEDKIDVTLITDNMAAYFMAKGEIDLVVVGADRIAANGDAANKIGTYSVALAACAHDIPLIVAAPVNTVDMTLSDGSLIPIEERDTREVTHWAGQQVAPDGVKVRNPAFDVTPHELITAIVTDKGAVTGDFRAGLEELFKSE